VAEMSEYPVGTPSWADIGSDVEAAQAFYGALFGWDAVPAGPPEETGGYGFFTKGGRLVAGFGPQNNPGPPFWSVYFATDDAEGVVARVEAAGGTVVVAPMAVMDAGRMAVFQDSAGAFFSVWQPGSHRGAQLWGEPGAMCWAELTSRDVEGAKRFYPAVFGWHAVSHEGEMAYTEFHLGEEGPATAGLMDMPAMVPAEVPSYWSMYFGAEDVDASSARAVELGGIILAGPMDLPDGGRFAVLRDPQGAVFGLFSPAP